MAQAERERTDRAGKNYNNSRQHATAKKKMLLSFTFT
jgi:hypothetical protein